MTIGDHLFFMLFSFLFFIIFFTPYLIIVHSIIIIIYNYDKINKYLL